MNIPFEYIVSLARKQAREARDTALYVDQKEFENQLSNGEAHEQIHRAACIVLHRDPGVPVAYDDGEHYAVESTIAAACVTINKIQEYHRQLRR